MSSEKFFLSGYLHRNRNIHSKFHVSSSSSFGSALICHSVSQSVSPFIYVQIMAWDAKLKQTGSLLSNSGKHAKKRVSEVNIELIRNCITRSPRKSIRKASLQLQIPRSTVHNVVHKRLRLRAYKILITQKSSTMISIRG